MRLTVTPDSRPVPWQMDDRLVCIQASGGCLTVGRLYDVHACYADIDKIRSLTACHPWILNDHGKIRPYPPNWFRLAAPHCYAEDPG